MNILKKIAWVSSIIIPIAFCFFLYKTYNGDYDSNFTFLIPSILLSFLTIAVLVFLNRVDKERFKKNKWIKAYVVLFGMPMIYVTAWTFMTFTPLLWKGTKSIYKKEGKFTLSKYQNFFKTRYIYHDAQSNSDTIIITVTRTNNVQSIKTLKAGQQIATDIDKLPNRDKLAEMGLFNYGRE